MLQFRRPVQVNPDYQEWRNTTVSLGPAEGSEALTRREAEAMAAELLTRVLGPVGERPSGRITVAEAVDLFLRERAQDLTRRGHEHYEYILTRFVLPKWGSREMESIRSSEVQKWLDECGEWKLRSTVQHIRAAMSVLWRWSMRYDRVNSNPIPATRASGRPSGPQRPLTPEECRRLLRELPAGVRELAEFLLLTGLRIGEALGLQRGDVNLSGDARIIDGHVVPHGCFIVRRAFGIHGYIPPKTPQSVRVVPLTSHAERLIRARLEAARPADDAPLWTGPQGGVLNAHNIATRVLKPAADRADVGFVHWHTFRHTAATLAELDVLERQRVLGRTQTATTARYSAPVADPARNGLQAIDPAVIDGSDYEELDSCI